MWHGRDACDCIVLSACDFFVVVCGMDVMHVIVYSFGCIGSTQ